MAGVAAVAIAVWLGSAVWGAVAGQSPWADRSLSPDARAAALVDAMTLEEKIALLHGSIPVLNDNPPPDALRGAGHVSGIARLGIPPLRETDAGLGVANGREMRIGDVATALPSALSLAATWNPEAAYAAGAVVGREARLKGFNTVLNGGVNLVREPRNGRSFEYPGEDPLLAGVIAGQSVRGIQSNGVISTVKHFAFNDQETGRRVLDVRIAEPAARESDLLAFQIAIECGRPGAVMTSYNRVNGVPAGQSAWLLNTVLKRDWQFPGWVMSDWGAVPDVAAATAGLDQESGEELDTIFFGRRPFAQPLIDAVRNGDIPSSRIDDMARRYLRSLIAHGIYDRGDEAPGVPDYAAHAATAQSQAEEGIVLLKNDGGVLPLAPGIRSIAVIGGHADIGVISGGGSSQVRPAGGAALVIPIESGSGQSFLERVYVPSAPLRALQAQFPKALVSYADGADRAGAARAAAAADVAIVFAEEWRTEARDQASLSLPDDQDGLIAAVAKSNPRTVVVLTTGGAVLMPWLGAVAAVVEAWYPGQRGGEAIARVLAGAVDASGRLPITFPASERQLPRPALDGLAAVLADPDRDHDSDIRAQPFTVDYDIEGSNVGYRWFAAQGLAPLFPFGFGLSYGTFAFDALSVSGGQTITARVKVTNTGSRDAVAVPQFYAAVPVANGPPARRLIGWQRIALARGESRDVEITADPRLLAQFDVARGGWRIARGDITVSVGAHANDARLVSTASVDARILAP